MRAELIRQTIDEAMRMLYADDWTPEDRDEIEASLSGIPGEIDRLCAENERLREALRAIGKMRRASRPGASGLAAARAIAWDALGHQWISPTEGDVQRGEELAKEHGWV